MLEKRGVFPLTPTRECFIPRMLHGPFAELFSFFSFLPLAAHKLCNISVSNLHFVAVISIHGAERWPVEVNRMPFAPH